MWQRCVCLLLGLITSVASAELTDLYNLPSFSLVLNVNKSENDLIIFQDKLNSVVQVHLMEFFKIKVNAQSLERQINEVVLSSAYIWKEIATSENQRRHKYEVQSNFDCHIEVGYLTTGDRSSRPSQSIMDLYLIEAFQGDNYWSLVHSFLKDDVLEDITGIQITVMADGYVHYNGRDPSSFDVYDTSGDWTPAMITGVVFATILVTFLTLMWSYICCLTRNSPLVRLTRFGRKKFSEKPDSATDDMNSTSTLNPDDEEEGKWMDQWAESVTSIPLREPVKPRKAKKQRGVRHPGHHHNTYLNSIEEVEDECSTVCSVESNRSQATGRQRIGTPTQEAILELDEDETSRIHRSLDRQGSASDDSESCTSCVSSASSGEPYDLKISRPQLESITELA